MPKEYRDKVNSLLEKIESCGLEIPEFSPGRTPTQAFSQFLINKRQGDWAERIVLNAINETFDDIIAVRYGRSEDIIAGEEGFEEFYAEYQRELSEIGKRPDILIFYKDEYFKLRSLYSLHGNKYDISMQSRDKLDKIVPHAIAGLEVRSSSFLVDKHRTYIETEIQKLLEEALKLVQTIRERKLSSLPSPWKKWIAHINSINDLRYALAEIPRLSQTRDAKIQEFMDTIKMIKTKYDALSSKQLSFTPKVEDLAVIKQWINTYGVPHYYVQVFFDRIYAISFTRILEIVSNGLQQIKRRPLPKMVKSEKFKIDRQPKNQFKITIYLDINEGVHIGDVCEGEYCPTDENHLPELAGKYTVLNDGRVIVAVDFVGGYAKIYEDRFLSLIGLRNNDG
ncbi:Type II restriction enzyme AccI [Thermococcus onnurineus NA1]|uniref:Type II restriction enzyme AccI n=1 Tax=Thermococcus onnurineus (strain NA1) TaxID=523850 RepID=B6YXQ9_THEON|nr:AccI family restriction endonuclease [Thermococcus onnurineus]ACJ16872.1 Type II restriction enzyme AccI [Thermococcus onnurineus NA1]